MLRQKHAVVTQVGDAGLGVRVARCHGCPAQPYQVWAPSGQSRYIVGFYGERRRAVTAAYRYAKRLAGKGRGRG